MSDIFGRELHDYDHLLMLRDAGQLDAHREAYGEVFGMDPKDQFRMLGRYRGQRNMGDPVSRAIEQNAQTFGYVTNNLLGIQTYIDEVLYQRNRLDRFMPLNMDIDEGQRSYGVEIEDWAGEAEFVDLPGTTVPKANVSWRLEENRLDVLGIDASWTLEDIRNAMFIGKPLMATTVRRAVEGTMNKMERYAFRGDARIDPVGLINIPTANVSYNRTAAVDFSSSTGDVIEEFIQAAISDIIEVTSEIFSDTITDGLCIFLPVEQFNIITSKKIGDNRERTIWTNVMRDNPWSYRTDGNPIMLQSLSELKDAGGTGVDRMIVTVKDMRIYEMGIAFMPRSIRTEEKGREICVPVEAKVSPPYFKRASTMGYYDGV